MKSAYELAMERLEKDAPKIELSEDQIKRINEIDERIGAKIAERRTYLDGEIEAARAAFQPERVQELEQERAAEIQKLEAQRESEKQKIRDEK